MDWSLWKKGMASFMAKKDGLELDNEHWEIINFLREYFEKFKISPSIRVVIRGLKEKYGREKGSTKYLYEKFPRNVLHVAKYTGIPRPVGM